MWHSLILTTVFFTTVYSQATRALFPRSACFETDSIGARVNFIADAQNSCWYWECIRLGRRVALRSRNCPLGTAVSSFFGKSSLNPCTERFDVNAVKFDCTRKKFNFDERPPCYQEYIDQGTCKNGGLVTSVLSTCQCDCSNTGFADWDCSKRQEDLIGATPDPSAFDPCPGGIPTRDFCAEAGNPCQNNGRCINQCLGYVCECIPPFTAGRECQIFNCSDNFECFNGGTCSRGPNNNNQYATCECLPGFSGLMCELIATGK